MLQVAGIAELDKLIMGVATYKILANLQYQQDY